MGSYCRAGWYGDEDEINIVVTHGMVVTTTQVIKDGVEQVISFRGAEHTVLGYQADTGGLKVGGAPKAQRAAIADIFARTMLERPDFFSGADSQNLYSLEPIEKKGFAFTLDHAFEPGIRRAAITEVQIEKKAPAEGASEIRGPWTLTVRDRWNALSRMEQLTKFVSFGEDRYRISHIVISLGFDTGASKPARLTVKLKPPGTAVFRRQRFEGRVIEFLRRNRLCRERKSAASAAAVQ